MAVVNKSGFKQEVLDLSCFFFSYFVITFNYVVEKENFGLTGIVELINNCFT